MLLVFGLGGVFGGLVVFSCGFCYVSGFTVRYILIIGVSLSSRCFYEEHIG